MSFIHYHWGTEEDTSMLFSGEPSRRSFDPFNGNQVLFLINCYASAKGQFSLNDAHILERLLVYQLPPEIKSERSVYQWIVQTANRAD